ncbi:membrane-bound transcription factor site-2 protease homolog isoform X2 [Telopea speciosissima]|uniref:membrane-bound transcription factor site-2 protease homolog isoform X2 n=1 Tax=Telopea speciosissima TaxID=54955 RepID=UPI001CC5857C|nr:membrane-bound transcription factor site-2 protease homolog isoform X2 [Telopea speciosissima]
MEMMTAGGERRGRRSMRVHTLLPLRPTHRLRNTISFWYCDLKITALNEPLFYFGRKYARYLRGWFSMGIGFSLMALLGVSLILLWELARTLNLYRGNIELKNFWDGLLFGLSPLVSGFGMSLMDAVYLIISTLISVAVHEFGHAIAAASEGVKIEYIAMFLAVLFPGALIAFNYEWLQSLPPFAALRIYCAGIWHNAVCCAVCGLALFLLPLILFPLYIHGKSPMVLGLSSTSPLSGFLSPGDLIVSLDGLRIHDPEEWMKRISLIHKHSFLNSNYSKDSRSLPALGCRKGYCVPSSLLEDRKNIRLNDDQLDCPIELTAFVTVPCFNSSLLDDGNTENSLHHVRESRHCLTAKDVVKLEKCGDGWPAIEMGTSSCECSQNESCLMPNQMSGMTWVEITYSSPYSPECLQHGGNSSADYGGPESLASNCGGTFVFVGDVFSMGHSVQLTAYQFRWGFILGAYLPHMLEKIFACTFNVSLAMALLNSLPVFALDGESILEVTLFFITFLGPRRRGRVLQVCLWVGTLLSILAFSRILFSIPFSQRPCVGIGGGGTLLSSWRIYG